MSVEAKILGSDDGPCFAWSNDNTRVLVNSEDSAGAYTLVEDRMKPDFRLGRHLHRTHAETFHILEGDLEFVLGERTVVASVGSTVHVPPGIVHAVRVLNDRPARMLMIYCPAGFDGYLERLVALSPEQMADSALMTALGAEYDIVPLES